MARIFLLYALLVVAIMKSTAATTTAEGITEVTIITVTDITVTEWDTITVLPSSSSPRATTGALSTSMSDPNTTNSTSETPSSLSSAVSATGMTGRTTGPTTETATGPTMELTTEFITERPTGPTTETTTGPTMELTTEFKTERPTEPTTKPSTEHPVTEEPTTKPPTEHPVTEEPTTKPPTEKPRVGPVPEPTLPDIDGDATKTYQFEFAVEENTTKGCMSDELISTACERFKYNVTQELEAVYEESDAFESVEVVLRAGSVIVSHNVTYRYNGMTEKQRMASAQDIYDETLGLALADGKLGNYTVQEDCGNCAPPEETSDICSKNVKCQSEYFKSECKSNYWVCESICVSDSDYCNSQGICWQNDNMDTQPICSCDWDNGEWYWGYRCQYYANQMYLIIGCSCGAAVLLVLHVSLIAYCIVKRKTKSDKESQSSDSVINAFQNLGYDHTAETVFPPIDDIDDGDILHRSRPYSYIYSKGEDNTNVESSSFIRNQNGGAQRESRLEVNEDAAKRQSNGSADNRNSSLMKSNGSSQQRNTEFWGNLNEPSAEHIKLEPFLDRDDDNNSYKIQRPRISTHYNYSNNIAAPNVYQGMDPAQTQHIPEADYAQI